MEARTPSFATARLLALALAAGVVLFWGVGWIVTGGGQRGVAPDALPRDMALWIWAALALAGFGGALALRGRAVAAGGALRGRGPAAAPEVATAVQTSLILAWALLEGPALLSGILFLLLGGLGILAGAVPVYLAGVALTFPRPEWFGESGARSR